MQVRGRLHQTRHPLSPNPGQRTGTHLYGWSRRWPPSTGCPGQRRTGADQQGCQAAARPGADPGAGPGRDPHPQRGLGPAGRGLAPLGPVDCPRSSTPTRPVQVGCSAWPRAAQAPRRGTGSPRRARTSAAGSSWSSSTRPPRTPRQSATSCPPRGSRSTSSTSPPWPNDMVTAVPIIASPGGAPIHPSAAVDRPQRPGRAPREGANGREALQPEAPWSSSTGRASTPPETGSTTHQVRIAGLTDDASLLTWASPATPS